MKVFIKNKKIIIGLIVLGALAVSSTALASLVDWPNSPLGTPLNPDESTLADFIKYLYEWAIALGGLAAFIALVIAGSQYMTSAGNPAQMQEAKDRIKLAFFGLVLLLGSWLILNVINPELTILRGLPEDFREAMGDVGGMACETDEDCKKWGDYVCGEDKICRQKWEDLLSQKPCSGIHILTESGTGTFPGSRDNPIEINMGGYFYYRPPGEKLQTLLAPGEKFWYWTDPVDAKCWGLLNIYEGAELGARCAKDRQEFEIQAHSEDDMGYGQAAANIFCMEFVEIPGYSVPEFAHKPRESSPEEEERDIVTPPEEAPYVDCPTVAYPDACDMEFTDVKGITYTPDQWCHGFFPSIHDTNSYRFCVGNTYYSFGCVTSFWAGGSICDSNTAVKRECTAGCTPWNCDKGKGCIADSGDCNCVPLTCGDVGGLGCKTTADCEAGMSYCNAFSSYECAECCCMPF